MIEREYPTPDDLAAAELRAWWVRFWLRVEDQLHVPELGICWVWTGATARGYGKLNTKATGHVPVFRWLWEQEHGPVPDGLLLDHLCRVSACIRPAHLEPVTPAENSRRAHAARVARLRA